MCFGVSTALWHWLSCWHFRWHWIPGGNFGPVAAAIVAIIVSSGFNVLTLRRAARQFQQQRTDARMDKLRAEIGAFTIAVANRRTRAQVLTGRVLAEIPPDTPQRFARVRGLLSEELSGVYQTITAHGFAIRLLTREEGVLTPLTRIAETLPKEREGFETAATRELSGVEMAELDKNLEDWARTIQQASDELMNFTFKNLESAE